jgi:hypothetical protein
MPQKKKHRRAEYTCDARQGEDGTWVLLVSVNGLKYEEVESIVDAIQDNVLDTITEGGRKLFRVTDLMPGKRGTTQ